MSQEATSADFAADELDALPTPPSDSESADGQPYFPDSVGRTLLESLGISEDEPVDPDEPEPQPFDEPAEAATAEATPPAAAPLSPDDQMARWVDQLLANPKDITRIPQRHQAAVLEARDVRRDAMAAEEIQRARQAGEQTALQRFQAEQQRQEDILLVARIDAAKANPNYGTEVLSPDHPLYSATGAEWYGKLRDSQHPDDVDLLRRYDTAKAAMRNPQAAQQKIDRQAVERDLAQDAASAVLQELAQYPAAMQRLQAKLAADSSLYAETREGLRQLTADATREIAAEQVAAQSKKEQPARQVLAQKQANLASVRATPRPDVSAGARGGDPLTDNVDDLLNMGFSEVFRKDMAKAVR